MEKTNESIRILDVIEESQVRGTSNKEFGELPLYEYISKGVLKESMGVKKEHDAIFYYDVSKASDELRESCASIIEEMEVTSIIRNNTFGKKRNETMPGTILTLLPIMYIKEIENPNIRKQLGSEFVSIENTPEGIKVSPTLCIDGKIDFSAESEYYVSLKTEKMTPETLLELSDKLIELIKQENGLYNSKEAIHNQKKF